LEVGEVTCDSVVTEMEGAINMVTRKLAFANAVAVGALAASFGTSAPAADLSRRPPPPLVVPVSPWTGFYIGGHVGGALSSEVVDFTGNTDPSGTLGGIQAGYNWQIAPLWVAGFEGDFSWTNATGSIPAGAFTSDHNWYSTIDARLGYIVGPGWLVYGKAGGAFMNAKYVGPSAFVDALASVNETRGGWNVGVGAEYLIAPQWSVKAEYDFLDFGKDNIAALGVGVDTQVNQFKFGVNYHFVPGTLFGR
jgi:outer membrane immunogenic protein